MEKTEQEVPVIKKPKPDKEYKEDANIIEYMNYGTLNLTFFYSARSPRPTLAR